jgi:hypothetical protein
LGTTQIDRLILISLLAIVSLEANAAERPRSVFIHATCDGKISSVVLSSLRQVIGTSQKYQVLRTLDDVSRMNVVLTLYMNCTEHYDIAAIAFVYGQAKCLSSQNCHLAVDGTSVRSALCDSKAAAECGRALFKAFDDYMSNPSGPPLKLQ